MQTNNPHQPHDPYDPHAKPSIDWRLALDLYKSGRYSVRKIADIVGCDESTVRAWVKTKHWFIHQEIENPEEGPESTLPEEVLEARNAHRRHIADGMLRLQRMGLLIEQKLDSKTDHSAEEIKDLLDMQWRWGRCLGTLVQLDRENYHMQGNCGFQESKYRDYTREEAELEKLAARQSAPNTEHLAPNIDPAQSRKIPHPAGTQIEPERTPVEPKPKTRIPHPAPAQERAEEMRRISQIVDEDELLKELMDLIGART